MFYNSISLEELKNIHQVTISNFPDEITKEMFKIANKVVFNFSKYGDIHKEIYTSWKKALTKFDKMQGFADYGYIDIRRKYTEQANTF